LFAHIKRHTGEFKVSCFGCKIQFNYRDIEKHKRTCVKNRKLFMCPFCNSSKTSKAAFNAHIQTVHTKDIPKTKCYFCNASFVETRLGQHLTKHTNEKVYKCRFCSVSYAKHMNLKSHVASKHRDTEEGEEIRKKRRRKCYFCMKYLASLVIIRNHMGKHTMETRQDKFPKHL